MSEVSLSHWSLHTDEQQIAWVTIDRVGSSVNSFNESLIRELDTLLDDLEKHSYRAIVFRSGKKTGFIAGADIDQFDTFRSAEEATDQIAAGQKVFQRLEKLKTPTIAMISGFCLGGGLEFALACRYRIAEEAPQTRLGLPEVKLGIHPGWGGTVRLPRLIGAMQAMDLILTGRTLSAKAASKMGVVDAAVPTRLFESTVKHFAKQAPVPRRATTLQHLTNQAVIRIPVGFLVGRQLRKKVKRAHYPAPFSVLDHWVEHGVKSDKAFEVESQSIGRLLVSDTSRHLVHVFHRQEQLKALAKGIEFRPKHVHVIGAGVMGAGIATCCAKAGMRVTLQDLNADVLGKAVKEAHGFAKKRLKDSARIMKMMDSLMPDPEGIGISQADVIIEAVSENITLKQSIFSDIERQARPDAVIATNTSTLCLEKLSQSMASPERLIGIHFFNPVAMMPLVEVIYGANTDQQVFQKGLKFVKTIDKLPLSVKSAPGFLVNRILMPYMLEAVSLLDEGVSGPLIDAAAESFGMPMGPITLADTVGLDVCLAALESMADVIGASAPQGLKDKVAAGHLGKKTGQGYYQYKNDKRVDKKQNFDVIPKDVIDRLILRMLNEAMAARREGLVENDDLLDAGSIFGFGFPPFRGGIMTYIRERGMDTVSKQLHEFTERYGERFKADAGWLEVTE